MTCFQSHAVSEDLLTQIEREHKRDLTAQLAVLKHCLKTENEVAAISLELELLEDLQNRRANARINSLTATRLRLNECSANADAAISRFSEALLNLDDDDLDDFETSMKKSLKLSRIEKESDDAAELYEKALLRVGWEILQAKKAGIIS